MELRRGGGGVEDRRPLCTFLRVGCACCPQRAGAGGQAQARALARQKLTILHRFGIHPPVGCVVMWVRVKGEALCGSCTSSRQLITYSLRAYHYLLGAFAPGAALRKAARLPLL